jgi:hypothetical protein
MLSKEEQTKMRNSIYNSKQHFFFIKYFADEGECFPLEIRPERVNPTDYDIGFSKQTEQVTYIINRKLGTEVLFHDLTVNQLEGYV